MNAAQNLSKFAGLRFGLIVHLGLYSLLGRGEWALNREGLDLAEYESLADRFLMPKFDANALVLAAKTAGAKYLVFTTMHHEGFALYDSAVNPFNSAKRGCKRDLVAEVVAACRKHGLRIHLYHSLNHWTANPDGVAALESHAAQKHFVDFAHARIRELVTKFNPIDCLWYDGWWPFNADGWRAEAMNKMVREIQPHILFNGRNGLPGDFATPEQHLTAPHPHRPWEACVTHNRSWGFHSGDHAWKSTADVIDMLTQVAGGAGNLILNIGPDADGAIPAPTQKMLAELGTWMSANGEAIYDSEPFTFDLQKATLDSSDWTHHGKLTRKGHTLFIHLLQWPGESFTINGVQGNAKTARLLGANQSMPFTLTHNKLKFTSLPARPPHALGGVLAVEFDSKPSIYNTGGLRVPRVPHPRYDPCPSDLPH